MASRVKIAKLLARRLPPGFIARKNAAYTPGFEYFAHGILIEGTPYKDTVYLRHLRAEFFTPSSFLHLSHSPRIWASANVANFHGSDPEIVEQVLQRLDEVGLLSKLSDEFTLAEYLGLFPAGKLGDRDGSPEVAIAAFLAGDDERSAEHLEWCRKWLRMVDEYQGELYPSNIRFRDMLRNAVLPAFEGTRDQVARNLRSMHRQNAINLGFIPKAAC